MLLSLPTLLRGILMIYLTRAGHMIHWLFFILFCLTLFGGAGHLIPGDTQDIGEGFGLIVLGFVPLMAVMVVQYLITGKNKAWPWSK